MFGYWQYGTQSLVEAERCRPGFSRSPGPQWRCIQMALESLGRSHDMFQQSQNQRVSIWPWAVQFKGSHLLGVLQPLGSSRGFGIVQTHDGFIAHRADAADLQPLQQAPASYKETMKQFCTFHAKFVTAILGGCFAVACSLLQSINK